MECHREGLSARRTYGWDTQTFRAKELSRAFDTHYTQDVQHAQQAQYDHYSDQYEQNDSQASMLQRGPRREPYIIEFYYYL